MFFFFFSSRRRHTRFKCDWSSDVCSSDLLLSFEEIKKKILGKKEAISCRPADLLTPGLEAARKEIGSLADSEEDVLSYALFPEIAREYFQWRDGRAEREQQQAEDASLEQRR